MADNDIRIEVVVSADGAVKAFNRLDEGLKDVKKSADNASGGFTSLEKKIITTDAALRLARESISLVAGGFAQVSQAVKQGAAFDDVNEAFKKLTGSAGTTANVLLNQLNSATLDTVSNFELMRKANENLRAGLKPDELITLTKAAKALSDQTGTELTQSIDQLTQAFRTGRVGMLQNALGVLELDKAEGKLGNTIAARKAILEAATKFTLDSGVATKDAADNLDTLNKIYTDNINLLYQSIANNQGFNESLKYLGEALNNIDLTAFGTGLAKILETTVALTEGFINLGTYLGTTFANTFPNVTSSLQKALGTGTYAPTINNASTNAAQKTTNTQVITAESAAAKQLAKDYETLRKTVDRLTGFDGYPKLIELIKQAITNKSSQTAAEYANALEGLGREYKKLGGDVSDFSGAFAEAQKQIEDAAKSKGLGSSIFENIFGINLDSTNQELQAQFANQMASAITGGLNLALTAVQGGQITAGQVGGSLGSIAGGIAGNAIGGPVGGAIGAQIGEQLGTLIGGLFTSKDGPGTAARKAADKFFADAFDANRLSVIVKGELVKINDLVFRGESLFNANSDFGSGSFSAYFKTLSDSTKQAFEGVGRAFEEIIGNSEDFAGQLGAIFANNIGGDLNNLQLLVQATGKSFEELGQAIEKAFQKGNLSAVQAQQSFAQLNQLSKPGVPGKFGAANTAFRNLLTAGAKGGNATLDALRDIGAEGLEAGITSIGALKDLFQQYVKTGQFSQKEVNVLFKALDNLNIKSTQQLSSANNNTLIALAAQLESTGVLKVIDGIVEQITKLPAEKTIKIKVDTQFTGDKNAARVAGIYADGTRSSSVSAR